MTINIATGFAGADKETFVWAYSENEVNFESPLDATRCTVSFAATELATYLKKILISPHITFSEKADREAFNIILTAKSYDVKGEGYSLVPGDNSLTLLGDGRVGVLYASYELLKLQGCRWVEPGAVGEYLPTVKDSLILPEKEIRFDTTFPIGRGFSIDGRLNENEDLFLWMARNRLNVYFSFPNSCRLMKKLGFILRDGGHIFEKILDPNKVMPSGLTMFEEHEDWYGLPDDKVRTREKAIRTQFCVSKPQLLKFLGDELLKNINDKWLEAEEINVWGFDTWGGICTCHECKALGNATDQTLFMASYFRDHLNVAREDGRLKRDIKMVLCAYEGSATIHAPKNPVPKNLIEAGDHVLFAPIVRCYEHCFEDRECSYNNFYDEALKSWKENANELPLSFLEYYNVSKFEDLPLLFTKTMKKDFLHFREMGARGICYMHIPMVNWGVRALTQVLYAELCWDANADTDKIIEEYFLCRYGKYASAMKKVYEDVSEASESVTSYRAWKRKSLLSKLCSWNGEIPTQPLEVDDHFSTPREFEIKSDAVLKKWKRALRGVEKTISEIKRTGACAVLDDAALNPQEQFKKVPSDTVLKHLLDDKRGLIYGVDTYSLSHNLGCYYNALYNGNMEKADTVWKKIESDEARLESYYMPLTFTVSFLGMISKDALTRTQMGDVITRCRNYRIKHDLKINI